MKPSSDVHTGDPSPAVTMTLVLVPTILAGSIASVFGLDTIAMMLRLLLWGPTGEGR